MKNILKICRTDLKRISTNVVAIVVILGLCAVPVLYAWFNIFSNWDPYGSESTGRIKVAVASSDAGAEVLGLKFNIGDTVVEALEANDTIGWVFCDSSDEALELVYSGDCYAGLIVPEDFTSDVVSFLGGEIQSPELIYYQNDKKNAIAPKITGKAKTAVQEQVNATFVETLTDAVAELVSVANANGVTAQSLLGSLSDGISELSEKLTDCCTALDAANGLADSAKSLISVSLRLCNSADASLDSSKELLNKTESDTASVSDRIDSSVSTVTAAISQTDADLAAIDTSLDDVFSGVNRYNDYVTTGLAADAALMSSLSSGYSEMASSLSAAGLDAAAAQATAAANRLSALGEKLSSLEQASEESWESVRERQDDISSGIDDCRTALSELSGFVSSDLSPKLHSAVSGAQGAASTVSGILSALQNGTGSLSGTLSGYLGSIGTLQSGLAETESALKKAQEGLATVSELVSALSNSRMLAEVSDTLEENGDLIGGYLASPIKMDTVIKYETETFGSGEAPFYTVLAQWIGALLCAVLLKVKLRPGDEPPRLRLAERFFGRYALFFLVALAQALIVSLGDLWYVKIQCLHPWLFVLAAIVTGLCFSLINYALVFALDNIGMGISVIAMVVQIAGSGGTYPVEVLPEIFRKLYNFMPFKYAMNAIRETVAGMYGDTYLYNIEILLLICVGAIISGLALYYPCLGLNRLIQSSKRKSEIML